MLWTTRQAANFANIKPATLRYYVARGTAPKPVARETDTGEKLYDENHIKTWLRSRPGKGGRPKTKPQPETTPPCTTKNSEP